MSTVEEAALRVRWSPTAMSLPVAVTEAVLVHLPAADISHTASVCRQWRIIAASDSVWRPIVLRQWSVATATSSRILISPPFRPGAPAPAEWRARYRELQRIAHNWKIGHSSESSLQGHTARINALTCSNDLVISCSEDQTIRVWNAASRTCLHVLRGHTSGVTDIRFDGKVEVVSSSQDGSVRVWSLVTGTEVRRLLPSDHASQPADIVALRRLRCTPGLIIAGGYHGQVFVFPHGVCGDGVSGQIFIWARTDGFPLWAFLIPSVVTYTQAPVQAQIGPTGALPEVRVDALPPIESFDSDAELLVAAAADSVFVWDLTPPHHPALLLTLWHPGVRTVRLLRSGRLVTLGGLYVHVFCLKSGYLLQSFLIRNHTFIPQVVALPEIPCEEKLSRSWTIPSFDRFVLETSAEEAESADLGHVRVWRAFGPGLGDAEALKILVSRHHAKCSNNEVLVVANGREHGVLTLTDYAIPAIPVTPPASGGCFKLCRCTIL